MFKSKRNNYTVMKNQKQKLTSVKVDEENFEQFKIESFKYKFTLNKLVNNALVLFLTDKDFRNKMLKM